MKNEKEYLYRLNGYRIIVTAKTAKEARDKAEKIYLEQTDIKWHKGKKSNIFSGKDYMELGFFNGK